MPITIQSNTSSLRAQRALTNSSARLSASFERLSTGLRIIRASDDAAGLSIASDLHTQARVYGAAIRNINDGVSALSIADGALAQLSDITIRQLELAEQAANGVYGKAQRQACNKESRSLTDEYNRIVDSTSFNGRRLLDLSFQNVSVQAGFGTRESLGISVGAGLARNVGDRTFALVQSFATGTTQDDGYILDINGDGHLDYFNSTVGAQAFFGDGSGRLSAGPTSTIPEAGGGVQIAYGDFNGDSIIDIAGTDGILTYGTVRLGNSNGTFQAGITLSVGSAGFRGLSAGDLDGDGATDLVGVNYVDADVYVWRGNGNGSFQAAATYNAIFQTSNISLADFNGDGKLDIVTAEYAAGGRTAVFINRGDGSYNPIATIMTRADFSVVTGDVNNDGFTDFIGGGNGSGNYVELGNGNGTFRGRLETRVSSIGCVA